MAAIIRLRQQTHLLIDQGHIYSGGALSIQAGEYKVIAVLCALLSLLLPFFAPLVPAALVIPFQGLPFFLWLVLVVHVLFIRKKQGLRRPQTQAVQ